MPLREAVEDFDRTPLKKFDADEVEDNELGLDNALEIIEEQKEKIEELKAANEELKEELKVAELAAEDAEKETLNYGNDPDPYGYHGMDLTHRLEAIGVDLNA